MSHVSDLDHRKIDATVYPDCVVEVHRVSDRTRGLRKVPVTKIWLTEQVLGRGTFGEVHLQVQDREPESKRAVKVILTDGRMSDVECKRELTALLEFSKQKYKDEEVFVHFLGWFQNDNAIYIAMEYIPLGDLERNLQELEKSDHTGCVLPEEEVKDIIAHILEGVKIMHAEGFAHRDLKPQNVLVVQRKPRWWVKLSDFGLSKRRTDATAFRSQAGTQSYMAPEMFHYVPGLNPESSEYTSAVDIWALGCIMYRILTGKPPFLDLWSLHKYCKAPELLLPPTASNARKQGEFLQLLLTPHPDRRPRASLALEHPWFATTEQSKGLAATELNNSSKHMGTAVQSSIYITAEANTRPATMGYTGSQFDYKTASHAGLHSHYQIDPKNIEQNATKKPQEWPIADLLRMREPMPQAFDIEFDAFDDPEHAKYAAEKHMEVRSERLQLEDEKDVVSLSDEDLVEEAVQKKEKRKEEGGLGYSTSGIAAKGGQPRTSIRFDRPEEWEEPQRKITKTSWFDKLKQALNPSASDVALRVNGDVGLPQPSLYEKTKRNHDVLQMPKPETLAFDPSLQPRRPLYLEQIHFDKKRNFIVRFRTFTGHKFEMSVNPKESIRSIKYRLTTTKDLSTNGLSMEGLRLNFNGELLRDDAFVRNYEIEPDSWIDLRWINN